MLQQTQVKTVIPFWNRWLRELPTIEAAANAPSEKIHKLWEGLGYYTRVRNLQKAAQVIVGKHGGKFPENFDEVLALPGIGRYTAGAICSIAFNQPAPILDGNVIRVLARVFGIGENPKAKQTNARLWKLAEELVLHSSLVTRHSSLVTGLFAPEPILDGTRCADLHAAQPAVPDLPGEKTLCGFQGKSPGCVAPSWQTRSGDKATVCCFCR